MVSANYEAYKSVMRQAFRDGEITPEEKAVLDTLRQSLNISQEEHEQIESEVQAEFEGGGPIEPSANFNSDPSADINLDDDANVIRPGMNHDEMGSNTMFATNPGNDGGLDVEPPVQEEESPVEETLSLEELLRSGKAAYHKNNFQQAIDFFDKAIKIDPENSEALFFRKRSQSKLQESGGGAPAGASAGTAVAPGVPAPVQTPPTPKIPPGEMRGDPDCTSCNGSGTCRWCKATGSCYWCKGIGQCDKCKGTGITKGQQCTACAGSGKCHSCKGSGKCYWCQGTGRCSKCNM